MFLNAIRRDRTVQCLPLRENSGSVQFVEMKEESLLLPWELKCVRWNFRLEDLRKSFYVVSEGVPTQFSRPVPSSR